MFGSFFACYPIAASVCRTYVQDSAGGKTQVYIVLNTNSNIDLSRHQTHMYCGKEFMQVYCYTGVFPIIRIKLSVLIIVALCTNNILLENQNRYKSVISLSG